MEMLLISLIFILINNEKTAAADLKENCVNCFQGHRVVETLKILKHFLTRKQLDDNQGM